MHRLPVQTMKISVVGPGALGCLLAATLARAGHRVWLIDHRPERARRIVTQGITLYDRPDQPVVVPIQITADPTQVDKVQIAFLCVKSGATAQAALTALPSLTPDGLLISLQNGIAHHAYLIDSPISWALGVTAQGAHLLGEGIVKHGGAGPTFLGFLGDPGDAAQTQLRIAADLLTEAGIAAGIAENIVAAAWDKLIVNVGINALTVVENCPNGDLLDRPNALAALKAAVQEAVLVAKAYGIAISDNQEARVLAVCRDTGTNISSMLQDIRAGRPTEIDALNGEIVRLADAAGIPTPINAYLVSAIRASELKSSTKKLINQPLRPAQV